jgi:hypothetical protein
LEAVIREEYAGKAKRKTWWKRAGTFFGYHVSGSIPMTQQSRPLNYRGSVAPLPPSAARTRAWFTLLIVGILQTLVGACVALTSIAILLGLAPGGGSPSGPAEFGLIAEMLLALPSLGIGGIFLAAALLVRTGSYRAAWFAQSSAILNGALLPIMFFLGLLDVSSRWVDLWHFASCRCFSLGLSWFAVA